MHNDRAKKVNDSDRRTPWAIHGQYGVTRASLLGRELELNLDDHFSGTPSAPVRGSSSSSETSR